MSKLKRHKISAETRNTPQKKKRFSKEKLWTIILGVIMVSSAFGIMLSSDTIQEKRDYKEHKFDKIIQGDQFAWRTKIDGNTYTFDYHPTDLEAVNFTAEINSALKSMKNAYVTFDPNAKHVDAFELARFSLGQKAMDEYGLYLMNGITAPNSLYNQPIVDCANATQYVPVIKFALANDTAAYLDGNCIVIEANEYSIGAMKDRILYAILGIIE